MTRSARLAGRFLTREVIPVVGVALAVFLTVRRICVEQYLVPSQSMSPTLVGDPRYGDRVLVDKTARWWWRPERFDMVVLRNPDDPTAFLVKRLVGLPGESLTIQGGDLWLGAGDGRGGRGLRRVEKDPVGDHDLRVPWLVWSTADGRAPRSALAGWLRGPEILRTEGTQLRLLPGALTAVELQRELEPTRRRSRLQAVDPDGTVPGFLSTAREIDTSHPLPGRRRGGDPQELARDPALAVRVVPEEGLEAILMAWEHRGAVHRWTYTLEGELSYLGPDGSGYATGAVESGGPLEIGRSVLLRFGHLDGRRFLALDDKVLDLDEVSLPQSPYAYEYPRPRPPRNGLHIGCSGRGGLRIESLEVYRDLQYRAPDVPRSQRSRVVVPDGEFFLLGDNAAASRDSSSIEPPRFAVEDLVGRPMMVLAPGSRRRTLNR